MNVKKLAMVVAISFLLVGCKEAKKEKKVDNVNTTYNISDSYYRIASPYKGSVTGNYVANTIKNKYDLQEVETGLMRISTKYFSKEKTFYQKGQYLNTEDVKHLLSQEGLNNNEATTIDGQNVVPNYVSYVYEEDYLKENGDLKGISVALVLNPYQNIGNATVRQTDEVLATEGAAKAKTLIEYLRKKEGLEKTPIVIALYFQNKENAILPGNFAYETMTSDKKVPEFNKVNEKYYLMLSSELADADLMSYNAIVDLEKQLKEIMPQIAMMSKGLYIDNTLTQLKIEATITSDGVNEVLAVSQVISNQITSAFAKTSSVKGIVRYDNQVKSVIVKNENQPEIYLVDEN